MSKEMKIVNRKISELISSEYNPRQLTEKQYQDLTDSMRRFGVVDPVIINRHPDRDNIVVGGHMRMRVWRDLGNSTIPTVEVELDRDKERELNVRLNRNTGEWDWDALVSGFDIGELTDWGFDGGELGFEEKDYDGGGSDGVEQATQLPPTREYIVVMCDADSWQFDKLIELLKLKNKRRGGYKRGSAFDAVAMERVVPASRLIALLVGEVKNDNSST